VLIWVFKKITFDCFCLKSLERPRNFAQVLAVWQKKFRKMLIYFPGFRPHIILTNYSYMRNNPPKCRWRRQSCRYAHPSKSNKTPGWPSFTSSRLADVHSQHAGSKRILDIYMLFFGGTAAATFTWLYTLSPAGFSLYLVSRQTVNLLALVVFFLSQVFICHSADKYLGYFVAACGTLTHNSIHKTRRFMTLIYVAWPGIFMWTEVWDPRTSYSAKNRRHWKSHRDWLSKALEGNHIGFNFETFAVRILFMNESSKMFGGYGILGFHACAICRKTTATGGLGIPASWLRLTEFSCN